MSSKKKGGSKLDSIATFWNTDVFEKIDEWALYFKAKHSCKIYNKEQVALFIALRVKNPSRHFYGKSGNENKDTILLIANTHIIFNNSRGDIKMSQIDLICKSISYLKKNLQKIHPD